MTAARELLFLLPQGSDAVSGGNLYNAQLLRGLAGRAPARVLEHATFFAHLTAGEPGVYFIDSLDLHEGALLPARQSGQHVVLIVHHLPSLEPEPNADAVALERAVLPRFDGYLCTSPFTRAWLAAHGCERRPLMTVPPGLPAVTLGPAGYEPPLRALLVGNLIRRKGVLPLLAALGERVTPNEPFSLEIRGRADLEPAYAAECRHAVARSFLAERVRFLEPLSYADMGERYRHAHAFVSAASMETYGMALAEARAHGVPVLALDAGYTRHHVLEGVTGATFASVSALADELLRLVQHPDALSTLRESARKHAAPGPATWPRTATELLSELERAFSTPAS